VGSLSWSAAAGRLAFARIGSSKTDLFTIRPDGTGLFNVTSQLVKGGTSPIWSPDGKKLLFACVAIEPQICLINADGSGLLELTIATRAQRTVNPTWSPDGKLVAYQSNLSGLSGVRVISAKGGDDQTLPGGVSNTADSAKPAWSPDGKQLLFQSDREGNWDLFLMDPDGSNVVNLTQTSKAMDVDAAWSPDGQKVAFRSNRNGNWELFVANRDGTGVRNITSGKAPVFSFAWSGDGQRLAFASGQAENSVIYVVNAHGSGLVNIANDAANPIWLSTGK
jgi:Tol biopolymer transport system component